MSTIAEVMEGDAGCTLSVSFFDLDESIMTPTTVEYRVDCLTNAAGIKDLAVVSAAAVVTITLDGDDTAILNADNEDELRQVTVVADRGLATQKTEQFRFYVRSSFFLPIV